MVGGLWRRWLVVGGPAGVPWRGVVLCVSVCVCVRLFAVVSFRFRAFPNFARWAVSCGTSWGPGQLLRDFILF